MYTSVAKRENAISFPVAIGYVPVAQRQPTQTIKPFDIATTPQENGLSFTQPYQPTAISTPSFQAEGTPTVQSAVGNFAVDTGRSIARNIASAGITISSKINPDIQSFRPDDIKSLFGQALFETTFGKDEIKPIETRIAEGELAVKEWQSNLPSLDTPGLTSVEKTVLKTLANLKPSQLSFPAVMGSVALDMTPFGGLEKNAYKTFIKTATEGDALILLKRMGVSDDIARNFAPEIVKVATEKDAKKVFESIVNLQLTTKQGGVYKPVAERVTPKVVDDISIEATKYKTAEEFVKAQGVGEVPSKDSRLLYHVSENPNITELKPQSNGSRGVFVTPGEASRSNGYLYVIDRTKLPQGVLKQDPSQARDFYIDKPIPNEAIVAKSKITQGRIETPVKSQLTDIWNKANKKQLPTPEELPKIGIPQVVTQKTISPVDRFIAEGKIKINRIGNRDVYSYKKGDKWQRARDEDSAVKAVTPVQKPVNYALEEKKIELEIKKEVLANHPAQGLGKYVSKKGEFKGELKEVTGKGGKFSKTGDSIITEKGFTDSEQAREAYQDLLKRKEEVKRLETEVRDMKKTTSASEQALPSPLEKEQVQSLEEVAQQAINTVDEPFVREISPLKNIITDTSTPVKEKVNMLDYVRTPDRVLNKIGLGDVAKQLRLSYDNYIKELPVHLQIVTDWSKEVSKESNTKIFKWLDGQKITLDDKEIKVANEIKQYLEEWAFRLGLPEDDQITHYITHIFDLGTNAKEFDEDIAKIIKDKVPGSVYDPFLEKRLGKKGYIEDTWKALDAYIKRAVRKSNMDPALEQMKRASVHLEESQLNYVTRLGARINMRPTEWDNLLDNTIKQLVGYRFGQRPTAVISGALRNMVYRGALGLNINSAVKNLTQGVNTFAKLGARDTLLGYINLMKPGMSRELEESGVLRAGFIQDRTLSATKQMLQKVDKGLFTMFEMAEKINRGSAYFGAKASALRKGLSEEQAIAVAKKMVRDTQFQFGSIDTPVAMQGDIAKTLLQFGSFTQKQVEFLSEMAGKREWAGIVRYILASTAIVYTAGQVFNIKGQDFNPFNYFSRFGTPPSLALPVSVMKAVTNMPDQYGKTPTTKAKIKDITYSGTTLIPAGVQLKKFLNGDIIGGKKPEKKKDKKTKSVKTPAGLPKLPSLEKRLPTPLGLPKLPSL